MHKTSGQIRAIKKIDTTDLSPREVAHEAHDVSHALCTTLCARPTDPCKRITASPSTRLKLAMCLKNSTPCVPE
ncbi:unnamed protein product [Effrenium voratum]|nr:unnamed protein product [Effrenium voratum]